MELAPKVSILKRVDCNSEIIYKTVTVLCSTVLLLLALCVVYNVVVQFYRWFKFYFPLFWGTVMYDKECKTKGNEIYTKDNIEPQHKCKYTTVSCYQVSFKASD